MPLSPTAGSLPVHEDQVHSPHLRLCFALSPSPPIALRLSHLDLPPTMCPPSPPADPCPWGSFPSLSPLPRLSDTPPLAQEQAGSVGHRSPCAPASLAGGYRATRTLGGLGASTEGWGGVGTRPVLVGGWAQSQCWGWEGHQASAGGGWEIGIRPVLGVGRVPGQRSWGWEDGH